MEWKGHFPFLMSGRARIRNLPFRSCHRLFQWNVAFLFSCTIAELRDNLVPALSEIQLFEDDYLAVMFTQFVMATTHLSWLFNCYGLLL